VKIHRRFGLVSVIALVTGALVIPTGWATAAPRVVEQGVPLSAASSSLKAKSVARVTMTAGPRLQVRVGPAQQGAGAWRFTLERQSGGTWRSAGNYRTSGPLEEVLIPVSAGTYRIAVPAQLGYEAMTSKPLDYSPAPEITLSQAGGIEIQVAPIRQWQVVLERKTDRGWSKACGATTRGMQPIVCAVGAGTYRVRTEANGRFPQYTGEPFDFAPRAPAGPVDLAVVDAAFSIPGAASRQQLRSAATSCGSVMNKTATGLWVASGFLSFVPVAGDVLALATDEAAIVAGAAGSSAGSACVEAQFQVVNQQLAFQEQQIGQLQSELQATQDAIIQAAYAGQLEVTNTAAYLFNTAATTMQNDFSSFMADGGFWSGPNTPAAGASVSTTATNTLLFEQLASFGAASAGPFTTNLDTVSGSNVNIDAANTSSPSCSGSYMPPVNGSAFDCYKAVLPDTNSAIYLLYGDMYTQLQVAATAATAANQNVVPLFDQYNQGLAAFYGQALGVLQQGFSMEYTINQTNLYNGLAFTNGEIPKVGQIVSLGEIPGTYYSYPDLKGQLNQTAPTAAQQVASYNKAQKALAQVYAARVNQLYLLTVGYIVSDPPITPQAWPTVSAHLNSKYPLVAASLNYGATVGKYVKQPIQMLPSAATNAQTWQKNAALYQYAGLRNLQVCANSLKAYNQANGANGSLIGPDGALNQTSCPSILTTAAGKPVSAPAVSTTYTDCASYAGTGGSAAGSCYDGNTLSPYSNGATTDSGATGIALGSTVINNLLLCSHSDPTLTLFTVGSANSGNAAGLTEGDSALTCGNWAAVDAPGWSAFPKSTPPLTWNLSTQYQCPSGVSAAAMAPYCQYTSNFWGPFKAWQVPCDNQFIVCNVVSAYSYELFTVNSGYYVPQNQSVYYVPSSTTQPVNIGGPNAQTNMAIASPSCSNLGSTAGASLLGCTLELDGVASTYTTNTYPDGSTSRSYIAQAELSTLAVALPKNSATGTASGGFVLPLTVGAAWGTDQTINGVEYCSGNCTLVEMWLSANTSIVDVGYTAPASVIDASTGVWSQSGYITVADGSCWSINVGRNANNRGTISFSQITPGSRCAA
jgi:hypothetical protein